MKDIFGQTLGQDQKVTIHTSNFAPGAWAPSGLTIIPAGTPIALNFYATNLPGNRYQAAYARYPARKMLGLDRRTDRTAAAEELAEPRARRGAHQPAERRARAARKGARRAVRRAGLRLPHRTRCAGHFAGSHRHRPDHQSRGLRAVVPVARHGARSASQRRSAGAFGGGRGLPHRGSRTKPGRSNALRATTDAGGKAEFRGVDVERCAALASANQAPTLGFVVTSGADVATLTVWSWSGI